MAADKEVESWETRVVEGVAAELDSVGESLEYICSGNQGIDAFRAKAAFIQVEPYVDNSIGLFMPFYGYLKTLFLLYFIVTRPSVSPIPH